MNGKDDEDEPESDGVEEQEEVTSQMRRRGLATAKSASIRLVRPEVSLDAYRSAHILRRQHGDRAKEVAGVRLQALLDARDEGGVAAWRDILYAIEELARGPRNGEAEH